MGGSGSGRCGSSHGSGSGCGTGNGGGTGASGPRPPKRRVLFLCTGNSTRSQIAEALVRARWGRRWEAFSAGTHPAGFVHPEAVAVLAEWGISAEGARSKSVQEFAGHAFDLVVTVCDQAQEACPVWPGQGRRVHVGFPDPAAVQGTPETVRAAFRQVRDGLARRLEELLGPPDQ